MRLPSSLATATLLALLPLFGCGESVPLAEAERHMAAGRLERASELLAPHSGPAVERLRAALAERTAARAAALAELEALVAGRDAREPGEVLDALRGLVASAQDPVVREQAEVALSTTYDWVAERRSAAAHKRPARTGSGANGGNASGAVPERDGAAPSAAPATPADPLAAAALREFERLVKDRDWRNAVALATRWAEDPSVAATVREAFADWRRSALAQAAREADELVLRAWRYDRDGQRQLAVDLLAAAHPRFPEQDAGASGGVARVLAELGGADLVRSGSSDRLAAAGRGAAGAGSPAAGGSADPDAIARAGSASPGASAGTGTAPAQGAPAGARDVALGPGSTDGGATDAGTTAAGSAAAETTAAGPVPDAAQPRPGRPGDDRAVAVTDRKRPEPATERGPAEGDTLGGGLLGPGLGEVGPVGAVSAAVLDLALRLETTSVQVERDAAFSELLLAAKRSTAARELLGKALVTRFERSVQRMERAGSLRRLERVAEARQELDAARERALRLIFDEERYFYPYTGPDVPADRAALYPAVQREVDELVAEVARIWRGNASARVPEQLRNELPELAWLRRRQSYAPQPLTLPEKFPAWIEGLPQDLDEVDVRSFAWRPEEARDLYRSRMVLARNEALWARLDADRTSGPGVANRTEREQVRITNDYRLMMGRRALAWHAALNEASRGHSEYMNRTGNFGHYEDDPTRHSPFDRMKLVGYQRGKSENCYKGGPEPENAHAGWLRSSGHHRNLLGADHKEMASGVAGGYWTQKFGLDTSFEQQLDLSGWRD